MKISFQYASVFLFVYVCLFFLCFVLSIYFVGVEISWKPVGLFWSFIVQDLGCDISFPMLLKSIRHT